MGHEHVGIDGLRWFAGVDPVVGDLLEARGTPWACLFFGSRVNTVEDSWVALQGRESWLWKESGIHSYNCFTYIGLRLRCSVGGASRAGDWVSDYAQTRSLTRIRGSYDGALPNTTQKT